MNLRLLQLFWIDSLPFWPAKLQEEDPSIREQTWSNIHPLEVIHSNLRQTITFTAHKGSLGSFVKFNITLSFEAFISQHRPYSDNHPSPEGECKDTPQFWLDFRLRELRPILGVSKTETCIANVRYMMSIDMVHQLHHHDGVYKHTYCMISNHWQQFNIMSLMSLIFLRGYYVDTSNIFLNLAGIIPLEPACSVRGVPTKPPIFMTSLTKIMGSWGIFAANRCPILSPETCMVMSVFLKLKKPPQDRWM